MNNYMAIKWITQKKWIDSYKSCLPRVNQKEIDIINNLIISTEIEPMIKKSLKNSFKKFQRKEHFKTHSMRPLTP